MRKNNRIKKGLNAKNISGVYVSFEVKGRNVERLMESLARQKITLYKIKKISAKKTLFSIKAADEQKFFAIINKVWYNTFSIKKLRYGGINYPFYFLIKNVGIAVGILLFTVVSAVSNDYIFSFEFTGSGSVYERAITYVLEQNGVKKFSRFSQINLSALEDILLAESEQLSFVSLKKSGNRLVVDSVATEKKTEVLTGSAANLICTVNGVLTELKVYRGTAVKKIGENVSFGDILVDGYAVFKEEKVPVNVIATATVTYFEEYKVFAESETEALVFAEERSGKTPIANEIVKKKNAEDCFYSIKLYFNKVITAG